MASIDSLSITDDEAPSAGLLSRISASAFAPIRNVTSTLTSKSAQRAYITTVLFTFASLILVGVSTTAYLLFYYNYVPQIGLERVVHLQFSDIANPSALLYLSPPPGSPSPLIAQQPYDINLHLHLPRTSTNLALGNFMLDLSLYSPSTTPTTSSSSTLLSSIIPNTTATIAHSRRPTIMTQTSPPLHYFTTLLALPWYLLGLRPLRNIESEHLLVPMFERVEFLRGRNKVPTMAHVELIPPQSAGQNDGFSFDKTGAGSGVAGAPCQGSTMQIYSLTLSVRARFSGLRWLMYNHRLISFVIFTTAFYIVSLLSMTVAWLAFSFVFSSSPNPSSPTTKKGSTMLKPAKGEEPNGKAVKAEAEDDSSADRRAIKREQDEESEEDAMPSLSDSAASPFPTLGRQMPLRMPLPTTFTSLLTAADGGGGGSTRGPYSSAPAVNASASPSGSVSRNADVRAKQERERERQAEADDEDDEDDEDEGDEDEGDEDEDHDDRGISSAFRDSGIGTGVEESRSQNQSQRDREGPGSGAGMQRRRSARGLRNE